MTCRYCIIIAGNQVGACCFKAVIHIPLFSAYALLKLISAFFIFAKKEFPCMSLTIYSAKFKPPEDINVITQNDVYFNGAVELTNRETRLSC